MSVTPGAADSLQVVSPIVPVMAWHSSLQQLCIRSGERHKRRGACYPRGFDRKCEIDMDCPMTILIRRLLCLVEAGCVGCPAFAYSLFRVGAHELS